MEETNSPDKLVHPVIHGKENLDEASLDLDLMDLIPTDELLD